MLLYLHFIVNVRFIHVSYMRVIYTFRRRLNGPQRVKLDCPVLTYGIPVNTADKI